MGNVQHNAEKPQEGGGKEPQQAAQGDAVGFEEQDKADNQGLAAKGKQWLFGKK